MCYDITMIDRRNFLKITGETLLGVASGLNNFSKNREETSLEQKNNIEKYKYKIGNTEISLTKKLLVLVLYF